MKEPYKYSFGNFSNQRFEERILYLNDFHNNLNEIKNPERFYTYKGEIINLLLELEDDLRINVQNNKIQQTQQNEMLEDMNTLQEEIKKLAKNNQSLKNIITDLNESFTQAMKDNLTFKKSIVDKDSKIKDLVDQVNQVEKEFYHYKQNQSIGKFEIRSTKLETKGDSRGDSRGNSRKDSRGDSRGEIREKLNTENSINYSRTKLNYVNPNSNPNPNNKLQSELIEQSQKVMNSDGNVNSDVNVYSNFDLQSDMNIVDENVFDLSGSKSNKLKNDEYINSIEKQKLNEKNQVNAILNNYISSTNPNSNVNTNTNLNSMSLDYNRTSGNLSNNKPYINNNPNLNTNPNNTNTNINKVTPKMTNTVSSNKHQYIINKLILDKHLIDHLNNLYGIDNVEKFVKIKNFDDDTTISYLNQFYETVQSYEKNKFQPERTKTHVKSKSGDFVIKRNGSSGNLSKQTLCSKIHTKFSPNKNYFNNYLKPYTEYFDPTCKYGGIDTLDTDAKLRLSIEKDRRSNSKGKTKLDIGKEYQFREYTGGWKSSNDYFKSNQEVANIKENLKTEKSSKNSSGKSINAPTSVSLLNNLSRVKVDLNIENKKRIVGSRRYI